MNIGVENSLIYTIIKIKEVKEMLIKRADLFLIKNIGDKLKDKVFNIQTQYNKLNFNLTFLKKH